MNYPDPFLGCFCPGCGHFACGALDIHLFADLSPDADNNDGHVIQLRHVIPPPLANHVRPFYLVKTIFMKLYSLTSKVSI